MSSELSTVPEKILYPACKMGRTLVPGAAQRGYRPGEVATVSGRYVIMSREGKPTLAARHVTAGDRFPPSSNPGESYCLAQSIETHFTTATSAWVIGTTSTNFAAAIERLAKK